MQFQFLKGRYCLSFAVLFQETAAYKQTIRETDSDVQPLTYWFANKERFPHLFDLAIRYLSVPTKFRQC